MLLRPGFVEYVQAATRLAHGFIAIAPALLLVLKLSDSPEDNERYYAVLAFFGLLTVLVFQAMGFYTDQLFSNLLRFRFTTLAWATTFTLLLALYHALEFFPVLNPVHIVLWFLSSLIAFGSLRMVQLTLFRYWMNKGWFMQRAVILGGTENGIRLAEYLHQNRDIRSGVIGFIDDRIGRLPPRLADLPLLGNGDELERLVREQLVTQIIVALPWSAENRIDQIIAKLRRMPVAVLLAPDMQAFKHARNRVADVSGLTMFNVAEPPLRGWSPLIKRLEDLVLASLCLTLALPVMLLLALAIKLDSPGPVLFRQKRYGYNNRLIEVYKFRSMYQHLGDANAERQTTRGDARVTRLGHFLRKTSLDELPQLFNVVQGTMSMVGPRPHATATKAAGVPFERAVAEYSARHRVKPGITGWAQVNGFRGETDTVEKIVKRVEFDLEYIENWSLWFDFYILFRTIPAVLVTDEVY